jgi:hypothetical protein
MNASSWITGAAVLRVLVIALDILAIVLVVRLWDAFVRWRQGLHVHPVRFRHTRTRSPGT